MNRKFIASPKDCILVTGSNGFIGSKVVQELLEYGVGNLRCFVRPSPRSFAWVRRPLSQGQATPILLFCSWIIRCRNACGSLRRATRLPVTVRFLTTRPAKT